MKVIKINEKDFMFRKFDGVYVALFFNDGDSLLFDDVGTVFIDAILKISDYDKALEYSLGFFENVKQYDVASDFENFINNLLDLNVIELKEEVQ